MDYAQAQYLSEPALFQRCFMQITSTRPKTNAQLTLDVKAGKIKAIDACLQVLHSSDFTANGLQTIANPADPVSKNVLSTFHHLHSSWFFSKDFPTISGAGTNLDIKDLYDASSPALYFTRALFKPSAQVREVLTTPDYLIPVRTNMDPAAGAATGHVKTDFVFTSPFVFAPTGDLLGVQPSPALIVNAAVINVTLTSIDLHRNYGGGVLGSESYLLENLSALPVNATYKTDGAIKMHRHWGKSVFRDFLCRELPVVREADVVSMVSASSPISFRTTTSCTKCHASHDRLSGVVRNMRALYIGKGDPTAAGLVQRGGTFADFHPVTMTAESSWGFTADADYYRRPPNGVLFFRDYLGQLVNQNVTGLNDLGQKMAATDDFYLCAAKRYYAYFTGIQVDMGDITDPSHPTLSASDLKHRDIVIALGKNLKQTQSLSQLISDILQLDHYKKIDFGIRSGANVQ